jgi:hypothetical protein
MRLGTRLIALWFTGHFTGGTYKMRKQEAQMKYMATMALMLNLGVASVYAQQRPVNMMFSGNGAPSTINLQQPNTNTAEENVAGNGALGPFTFRNVRAIATSPQPSSTCSGLYFPSAAGAGLFRFQDGSLLWVNLTTGGDCIDLVHGEGHCTLTFRIASGTGRFKDASGVLTYTETALPVLSDYFGNPVFFAETAGTITGTVSGVGREADHQEERQ